MGEEHFFAEGVMVRRGDHFGRDTRQIAVEFVLFSAENKGHQAGPGGDDVQAELTREIVAESRGADFGDGEPSGGDDQCWGVEFGRFRTNDELRGSLHLMDSAIEEDLHAGGSAFRLEHPGDILRGTIAEELAQRFFVVRDAMLLDESDEIRGSVTRQGGLREVLVRGDEVLRLAMEVGEIAAASAGDKDFFAYAIGALQHGDAPAALARFDGAEEAGRAGAENQSVKLVDHCGVSFEWRATAGEFPRRLLSRLN
jgi:hypothetical protein